jgi:hypothetical protein
MTTSQAQISNEEKRGALETLVGSASFRRHEQLQRFMRYVCELEMRGRASEIHEYQIGVDVFGKPTGYSTGEDAAVRTRAHALRRKLQEYYSSEAAEATVRIELPKGTYVPVFVRSQDLPVEEHRMETVGLVEVPSAPASGRRWAVPAAAFAAGVLATLAISFLWTRPTGAAVNPILGEAWGPLVGPSANTTIFMASPAHLFVRRLPADSVEIEESGRPLGQHELPDSSDLRKWFFGRYPELPGTKPYLIPTHNSPLWGDTSGALTAVGLLARSGAHYEIVPERASSAFSLRDRNAVVLGRPEYSPAAEFFLSNTPMTIVYSAAAKEFVLKVADRAGEPKQYADSAMEAGRPRDDDRYGLITVISSNGGTRTILFSGLASVGTQAAAEYFASVNHLRQLKARFQTEGVSGFPKSYQVLLRARAISHLPVHVEYVSHRTIER